MWLEIFGDPKAATSKSKNALKQTLNRPNLEMRTSRAWSLSFSPWKGMLPNLLMSYLSGSQIQIMTLSMTFYMFFYTPLTQICKSSQLFKPLKPGLQIVLAQAVYLAAQVFLLGLGVYKLYLMGF